MKIRPRVIPVLLYQKGGLVKTIGFKKPQYIGDPINAVKIFNDKEVDELIFLDIDATKEKRKPNFDFIKEIAGECFMPLVYGGGINTLDDIEKLVKGGVEKVCINSKAVDNPSFITEASKKFAISTIVVSIDAGKDFLGNYHIFSHGGTQRSTFKPVEFAKMIEEHGAGEILINSIDRDGTQSGYDLKLISLIASAVTIPVIACGGAAVINDFFAALEMGASAVAAGSMFVFQGKYKAYLLIFLQTRPLTNYRTIIRLKTQVPYQICTKCIMSTEDDPDIYFDEDGICNHCHLYDEVALKRLFKDETEREARLSELIKQIKHDGHGKEYDCIIGLSGGADSTYVAYITKKWGLRPLAVHCDNGWNSELAVDNIKNLVSKLNIDLVTHVINWEEFKSIQLAYLRASVVDVEAITDHALFSTLYNAANKFGVKYILSGEVFQTEGILPESWIHNKNDLINIKGIYRRFGTGEFKTFPMLGFLKKAYLEKIKRIQYVRILEYLNYHKDEAKETLRKELNWRDYGGKHYESIFTRFYQSYFLPEKFHIDKRRSHLSTQICSGQITREEALREASVPTYDKAKINDDIDYIIKKLGIDRAEFNKIMAKPPVQHTEYPSIVNIFKKLSPFVKGIRRIRELLLPISGKIISGKTFIPKGKRIAMLVDNGMVNDRRTLQESKTVADDFDVTIYAVREKGLPLKEIRDGVKIHRIFPEDIFKIQSLKEVKQAAKYISQQGFDIVHCHDHLMLWIGSIIKKRNPETVLIYDSHELFHAWPINYSSKSFFIRLKTYLVRAYQVYLEKRCGKYIDHLITVNYSLARILDKYFKLKNEPVVVRNFPGYENVLERSDVLRKKFNIPENNKILVYIGMHVYPKTLNIETVIDQVGDQPNLSFILICRDDIYRKSVENYARKTNFKNIYFHDLIHYTQIIPYLSGCDLGIVSTWNKKDLSYWYALDNKIFNYLMAEIPILSTAQPEYKEIIEKYNIGVCVNPEEPNAFMNGMEKIFQNYSVIKENIVKAKSILNWNEESKQLTNLYNKIAIRHAETPEESRNSFLKPKITMLLDNPFVLDKRVHREATALIKAGYQVTLLALKDDGLPDEEIVDGIYVKRVFDKGIFNIKQILKLHRVAKKLSKEKIDILHCHDWIMLCIGDVIKRRNPEITLIYDSHELFYSWPINYSNRKNRWLLLKSFVVRQIEIYREKSSAKNIDHLITVSSSFGENLTRHLNISKKPMIVKNIAEAEEITDHSDIIRRQYNIPKSTKVIVNLSLYIYQKSRNIEAVIDQFANVKDVALVFICKEGGNKKDIMQMVKDRGINNILFHDAIYGKEIVNTLSSCDIGIVTTWNKKHLSYWLGLENKIFHYIMAEIPILATAQPEHIKVIDKYHLGECVDADKPNAYVNGFYKIMDNYSVYKKNIIETKKFINWDSEKVKLIDLYKDIEKEINGTN